MWGNNYLLCRLERGCKNDMDLFVDANLAVDDGNYIGIDAGVTGVILQLGKMLAGMLLEIVFLLVNGLCAVLLHYAHKIAIFLIHRIKINFAIDDTFFTNSSTQFGRVLAVFRNRITTIALAIMLLIVIWQIFKSFFSYMDLETDNAVKLAFRVMIFTFLIYYSQDIIKYIISVLYKPIGNIIYSIIYDLEGVGIKRGMNLGKMISLILKDIEGALLLDWSSSWKLGSFAMVLQQLVLVYVDYNILILMVKFAEKSIVLLLLIILAPIAFACGVSKNTKHIFDGWVKSFSGVLVVYTIYNLVLSMLVVFLYLNSKKIILINGIKYTFAGDRSFIFATGIILGILALIDQGETIAKGLGFNTGGVSISATSGVNMIKEGWGNIKRFKKVVNDVVDIGVGVAVIKHSDDSQEVKDLNKQIKKARKRGELEKEEQLKEKRKNVREREAKAKREAFEKLGEKVKSRKGNYIKRYIDKKKLSYRGQLYAKADRKIEGTRAERFREYMSKANTKKGKTWLIIKGGAKLEAKGMLELAKLVPVVSLEMEGINAKALGNKAKNAAIVAGKGIYKKGKGSYKVVKGALKKETYKNAYDKTSRFAKKATEIKTYKNALNKTYKVAKKATELKTYKEAIKAVGKASLNSPKAIGRGVKKSWNETKARLEANKPKISQLAQDTRIELIKNVLDPKVAIKRDKKLITTTIKGVKKLADRQTYKMAAEKAITGGEKVYKVAKKVDINKLGKVAFYSTAPGAMYAVAKGVSKVPQAVYKVASNARNTHEQNKINSFVKKNNDLNREINKLRSELSRRGEKSVEEYEANLTKKEKDTFNKYSKALQEKNENLKRAGKKIDEYEKRKEKLKGDIENTNEKIKGVENNLEKFKSNAETMKKRDESDKDYEERLKNTSPNNYKKLKEMQEINDMIDAYNEQVAAERGEEVPSDEEAE